MDIVVTDLTRFSNPDIVCTAGIDVESRVQVRPMPYFSVERCRQWGLRPGMMLRGDFTPARDRKSPHLEDSSYHTVSCLGACPKGLFHEILWDSVASGLQRGFGARIKADEKCIPFGTPLNASLITLRITPAYFRIDNDSREPEKIKAHLVDGDNLKMSYVSVTDRTLFAYVQARRADANLVRRLNEFLHRQRELYLRVGLSRRYQAPDCRDGHWIQINGIYTFPECPEHLRYAEDH